MLQTHVFTHDILAVASLLTLANSKSKTKDEKL